MLQAFVVRSNCSVLCQQTDLGTDRAITLKIQDQESCFVEAIYRYWYLQVITDT